MQDKNPKNGTTSHRTLNGTRVLDFSWVLAGPYASRILADFGAEVIKVQPLLAAADDAFSQGYYNTWNRNKLSITLNLDTPEGMKIIRRLISISNVVLENFSPRVMDNWGLEYSALQRIRPDLIYLRMSAAGHSGPGQSFSGFGPTVQAAAGLTALTACPDEVPLGVGFSISDHVAGLYAAVAVLGALENRQRTGQGQYIDLSQTETLCSLLADNILNYTRETKTNLTDSAALQGIYRCRGKNRWIAITINNDLEWDSFKKALNQPPWADQPQFSTKNDRLQNAAALDNYIQAWTLTLTPSEAVTILQKQGIAAGAVQNAADLLSDLQLKSRGFLSQRPQPGFGKITTNSSPIRLSSVPTECSEPAPTKGEDNNYVYRSLLGLSTPEIDRLKDGNII